MSDTGRLAEEIKQIFEGYDFPEEFIRDYEQLECLAHHQHRETYLVRSRRTGELCVAKCYDRTDYDFSGVKDILSGLEHPGIPCYRGYYESRSMTCFVREYIEGTPLSRYAAENDLSREEITDICKKLADILIFLHGQEPPIIHRDIKPENIIVRSDGSVCLIDFDIARTFKETEENDTVFFGTKGYAAPEQYGFSQTDCRSDIFSFGVLLRFLLTDSVRANDKVRVYAPLQKIIDRCTAFAPEKRYGDMSEVSRDLSRANPRSQRLLAARAAVVIMLIAAIVGLAGFEIYRQVTYSPFKDGSVVPSVMPDEERQDDAIKYLQDKFGTHIFDDKGKYMTVGMVRDVLREVYGLDDSYVSGGYAGDPPEETPEHFFPWDLDDHQYIDPDQLEYVVVKLYWPDEITDWTKLKEDNGLYPGVNLAIKWCDDHDIMLGVNRPRELARGEAAIIFANADRVYEAMKKMEQEK